MARKPATPTQTVVRDAKTGRFVTAKVGKRRPKSTVVETIKRPSHTTAIPYAE